MPVGQKNLPAWPDDRCLHRRDRRGGLGADPHGTRERGGRVEARSGADRRGLVLPVRLAPVVKALVEPAGVDVLRAPVAAELVEHLVEADHRLRGVQVRQHDVHEIARLRADVAGSGQGVAAAVAERVGDLPGFRFVDRRAQLREFAGVEAGQAAQRARRQPADVITVAERDDRRRGRLHGGQVAGQVRQVVDRQVDLPAHPPRPVELEEGHGRGGLLEADVAHEIGERTIGVVAEAGVEREMVGQIAGRDRLVVAVAQPGPAFVLHLPPERGADEVGMVRDDAHVNVHLGSAVRGLAVRRQPMVPVDDEERVAVRTDHHGVQHRRVAEGGRLDASEAGRVVEARRGRRLTDAAQPLVGAIVVQLLGVVDPVAIELVVDLVEAERALRRAQAADLDVENVARRGVRESPAGARLPPAPVAMPPAPVAMPAAPSPAAPVGAPAVPAGWRPRPSRPCRPDRSLPPARRPPRPSRLCQPVAAARGTPPPHAETSSASAPSELANPGGPS